ncbi:hypothetical protein DQ237_11835 [Blastococcus sp. TF02-8]|nr:hypothetical protein DQ237_11835 [Blastococcus sp. TF02-8]
MACRLTGLTTGDLWLRYVELGGSRSRPELESRLGGVGWPERDDLYLSVVANEALGERGLPRLAPLATAFVPLPDALEVDDHAAALRQTAAVVLETRASGSRLTALFEQCVRARADARRLRERAQAFRRARDATMQPARDH